MDLVSSGKLASAVSQAGGLGMIGGGYGNAEWLEREFAAAGNARIGCGFITWSLAQKPEILDLVLTHRPTAGMLSFGDPSPFAAKIKDAGAKLICQVQSVAQGKSAASEGADRINSPWCAPACSSAFACRWVKGGWHALADAGSGPAV